MRALALLLLLALPAEAQRFDRECQRSSSARSKRGFNCSAGGPLFAFAGADGAGMGTPCAGTAITDSRGGALVFTRSSSGTCTSGTNGLRTSGIAPGQMVTLSSGQPRVESSADGVSAALIEEQGVNDAVRGQELDNAVWTATATVTPNAAVPPNTTNQISNAEQLNDASGAAFQGVCQTIATTSATLHAFLAYVEAGTLSSAQVTMTGVGSSTGDCSATVTGLSGSSYSIASCISPAPYAGTLTAVVVCINAGNSAASTGTIFAWGAHHQAAPPTSLPSYIPTSGVSATRNAERLQSLISLAPFASSGCSAATVDVPSGFTQGAAVEFDANGRPLYFFASTYRMYDGTTVVSQTLGAAGQRRYRSTWSGSTMTVFDVTGATSASGAFDGAMGVAAGLDLGFDPTLNIWLNGLLSRVQIDPSTTVCQ